MEITNAFRDSHEGKEGSNTWTKATIQDGKDTYEAAIYTQDGFFIYLWNTKLNVRTPKQKRNEIKQYLTKIVREQYQAVRSKNERVKREI
jgi:hypothetical protein